MSELLWQLPATELARRYRDRSLTPLDVTRACLARLEAVNPKLNAVVVRRDAEALQLLQRALDALRQEFRHHDRGPRLAQRLGAGGANALTAARHHRHAAIEPQLFEIHAVLPCE